ncbi:MAG: hypothetical protein D6753_15630 [Planctomycetota bacterium]|nr:MAG: hypothetical protein D6753_15630 [Planctomycetota bacterium]
MQFRMWMLWGCLALVACWGSAAAGQENKKSPAAVSPEGQTEQKRPEGSGGLVIAEVEGQLAGVAGDRLKVVDEDNQEKILLIDRETSLRYRATADPAFLRPGYLVRFNATFNPQTGVPTAAVAALEIFRPIRARRMTRELLQSQTPGIYPVVGEGNGEQKRETEQRGGASNRNGPTQRGRSAPPSNGAGQPFRIVGQIRAVQGNRLQVVAGRRPVVIEVAPDAKITVATGDLTFAAPGDKVAATGLAVSGQSQMIQAQDIVITAAQELGTTTGRTSQRDNDRRGGVTDPAPGQRGSQQSQEGSKGNR